MIGVLTLVFREDWRLELALTASAIFAFWICNLAGNIACRSILQSGRAPLDFSFEEMLRLWKSDLK